MLLGLPTMSQSWSNVHGMWIVRWTSVVLMLAITHAVKCPEMCDCQQPTYQKFRVDCKRSKLNESILVRELDQLLSDGKFIQSLKSLQISNTSLTQVPMSVCRLANLTSLNLDRNRLTCLPDNCFTGMKALQSLSASNNQITQLQDGLFDGLNSLIAVYFASNQIKNIGLWVFSNQSDLVNLSLIKLPHNKLQSIEPWPIIRGLHGQKHAKVAIDLDSNLISTFTNKFYWQFNCSMRSYANLWLSRNNIRHINDIAVGWNITSSLRSCFFLSVIEHHPIFEIYIEFSRSYICDCRDFFWQSFQRHFVHYGLLRKLVCSAPQRLAEILVRQVPLEEFVCESSDRCPPGCRCVYRPANATLHVYCSAANLSSLPFDLPSLPKSYARYKLDFSNNKFLHRLEGRPYFVNTSVLDVSGCAISDVDIDAWREIAKMQSPFVTPHVCLQNNIIKFLPSEVTDITNITSLHLTLRHNPWECSCKNRWIIDWFKSFPNTSSIVDVMCASPRRLYGTSIAKSTDNAFCVDPLVRMMKISLLATLTPVAILLVFSFVMYRLRVCLYTKWKFHPFDRDECVGEDLDYDVFLSCSSLDDDPHGLCILRKIELKGYRVCYHERDFLPGEPIIDGMVHGTERSKRTVCLVSNNFIQRYCLS